jgi:hypothetical protein
MPSNSQATERTALTSSMTDSDHSSPVDSSLDLSLSVGNWIFFLVVLTAVILSFIFHSHTTIQVWMWIVVTYNTIGALALSTKPEVLDHLFPSTGNKVNAIGRRILISWIWTFTGVRIACAIDICNQTVYWLNYVTFVIWFAWNLYEIFIAKSTPIKGLWFGMTFGMTSLIVLAMFMGMGGC